MKQAHLYRIAVVTLMLFVLLLDGVGFSANIQIAYALPSTTTTCTIKWQLPQSICDGTENCVLVQKVSESGYLYAFNIHSDALAVLKPDGQLYGMYDLAAAAKPQGIWLLDYVPFGNRYVLFMSLEGSIYKYILASRTLVPVTFQQQTKFLICSDNSGGQITALSRLGQGDNILACVKRDVTSPELSGIDLITFNQASLSTTTIRQSSPIKGALSWAGVTAGQDGFVYLLPSIPSFPITFPPNDDLNVVTKYDTQTQQWSIIRLPPELKGTTRLSLIDRASNLYFEHISPGATTGIYKLIKVNPSGQIVWQATEQDIGSIASLVGVSNNGNPILTISSQTNPAGLVQECAVTTTGTPASTPTRTLTPAASTSPTLTPGG